MPKLGSTHYQERSWAAKLGVSEDELRMTSDQFSSSQRALGIGDDEDFQEDISFNKDDVISACQENLNFLAAIATPTTFKFEFPPVLLTAWQILIDGVLSSTKMFPQIALGIPRGHAKTTLVKLFILYCILFTKKKFILVICSTASNAENIIADVVDMLSESNIMTTFGDWRLGREVNRQDLKKFAFRGRDIVLGAIGAEGSIRGLNIKHVRPDIMIFEDVQTKECSESQQQSQTLERWMVGTAMKAKSPYGCTYIFVGNLYPGPNSILKKLKTNPTWVKFISGAILADGTALWPELHSINDLVQELDNDIAMGHPEIFFSEVLNDTDAGINNKVDLTKFKEWIWGSETLPQAKFIIIDPSTGQLGKDAVSIGLFEVYDGIPGFCDLVEEVLSPGNTIRKALIMALKNQVRVIAVESTSYQYTLLYWFQEICTQLGITGIEAVPVYSGNYSKNARISAMLKGLMAGEVILHPSISPAVISQIANWNPLKRDNTDGLLDLITYAPRVLELYGPSCICEISVDYQEMTKARVQEFNSPF